MTSADQLVFAFFCLFVIFLLSTCVQSIPRIKLKKEGSWDADIYSLPSTVQTRVISNSEHFISIHIYRNHEDAPISLFIRCLFLDVVWIISFMAFNNMMCLSYNKEENGRATDRYEKTMKKKELCLYLRHLLCWCACVGGIGLRLSEPKRHSFRCLSLYYLLVHVRCSAPIV